MRAVTADSMKRVVVLGRGGAGKSTASTRLSQMTGLPLIELDTHFWSPALTPLSTAAWIKRQRQLAEADQWIMDGDLGPYDAPEPRLARADTVLLFDFSLTRCAWNAVRRSRERFDFWWWLFTWRVRYRRQTLAAIDRHAPTAKLALLHSPSEVRAFLAAASNEHEPPC